MHWLSLLFLGWLSFGVPIVVFLFWLCKRTALAAGATPGKDKDKVKLGTFSPTQASL